MFARRFCREVTGARDALGFSAFFRLLRLVHREISQRQTPVPGALCNKPTTDSLIRLANFRGQRQTSGPANVGQQFQGTLTAGPAGLFWRPDPAPRVASNGPTKFKLAPEPPPAAPLHAAPGLCQT